MTKEELIGRKFKHASGDYFIYKLEGNQLWISWASDKVGISYTSDIVIANIRRGDWKLIEEEPKMYKTSKGIEYGVGTQYTPGDKRILLQIKTLGDNYMEVTQLEPKFVEAYTSGTLTLFETQIDKGDWDIIKPQTTMKDYKQVDPKTIKFDFTNTKIKVNSKEEAKWVIESAIANKFDKPHNTTYEHTCFYFWHDYNICWAHNLNEDCGREYKEITIQDILNSNMKEVIEVGDVVEILKTQSSALIKSHHYLVDKIKGDIIYIKGSEEFNNVNWQFESHAIKLVSKGKKKEIITYETVVDLPGIPKGTKLEFELNKMYASATSSFGNTNSFAAKALEDTKFFKPIYKSDDVELKFSKYTATLSKEHGLIFTDNEHLTFAQTKALVKVLTFQGVEMAGYKVNATYSAIQVGCKKFTPNDLIVLEDAIKELEK